MSEWTKCQRKTCEPKRKAFNVPQEFRETYSFLNLYKFKDGLCRIIPNNPSTVKAANGNQANGNSLSKVSLNIFLQFLTPTIFSNLDSNWGSFNNYVDKKRKGASRKSTLGHVTKIGYSVKCSHLPT